MATSKGVVKSKVLFDYTKPETHGYLYKQGALHKAFKKRYFVLYPGYLVYYTDETKYKADVAKGSLQGRLHAVRIRGGECHHAKELRDAPRGCKFGFTVSAPDPINRRNVYLLNASSREERQQWMAAVKKCQVALSPKPSPKTERKQIVTSDRSAETKDEGTKAVEVKVTEMPAKSPDQVAFDSDSSSGDGSTLSVTRSTPSPTKYPSAVRRETGVAAALMPVNCNDEDDDEDDACTSFNGPYADSDDDIGPEPELCTEKLEDDRILKIGNGHVLMNGKETSPVDDANTRTTETVIPTLSNEVTDRPTVMASEVPGDQKNSASLAKTTSPEITLVPSPKATVSDNAHHEASSSEDTDDNPLPVGGHEDNPSDSGTTSDDDDDEGANHTEEKVEQATPGIKVINPSLPRKPPLLASNSSPSLPVEGQIKEPPAPVRRTSAPFLQKSGYLHKRGGKRQNWKERFFVLTPGMFTYYKNDVQRNKPVGEVKLKNSSVRIPQPGESKDQTYQFTVHTESQWNKRSNYVLAANSEHEMYQWIEAFKAAGQKVIMDAPPISQIQDASNTTRQEYDHTEDDDDSADEDENDIPPPVNPPPSEVQHLKDSEKKKPKKSIWISPFRERRRSSKSKRSSVLMGDDKKSHPKNLRGMVSKQKKRYQDGNYDLDLSYITDQIIAMGFPSEGAESMYRNKLSTVVSFLESKHRYHYKLYNLCSERVYAACKFKNRVAYYPFDDHSAPPFMMIEAFCQDVASWLEMDKRHVAVVHCKAGKGRTGCMIASYLLYSNSYAQADTAMKCFGLMRTHNGKGVTIPSQQRYVHYVEKILSSPKLTFSSRSLRLLSKVVMHTVPNFDTAGGCNPYVVILCNHEEVYTSKKPDSSVEKRRHEELVEWLCAVTLSGDVRVEFWDSDRFSDDDLMCCFHFNTLFIEDDKIVIPRKDMDRACKNKKAFTDSFAVELLFAKQLKGMFSKSSMT